MREARCVSLIPRTTLHSDSERLEIIHKTTKLPTLIYIYICNQQSQNHRPSKNTVYIVHLTLLNHLTEQLSNMLSLLTKYVRVHLGYFPNLCPEITNRI